MRLIRTDSFYIKSKPPFSEWPQIVHQFFREQGLSWGKFYYFFEELSLKACPRAVKDCPGLGEPVLVNGSAYGSVDTWVLSNIHSPTACTEADLLPLMKKLHRSYGFSEVILYYMDVDFFGQIVPVERDLTFARKLAEWHHQPLDPWTSLNYQLQGCGFTLHRDILGDNTLSMSIDLLRNGELLDPAPYVEALKVLLPGARHRTTQEIILTEEEQTEIAARNEAAAPLLGQVQEFFKARLPGNQGQNHFTSRYKLAPTLKKLSKQYGWHYHFVSDGVFSMHKITEKGQNLILMADSGPSRVAAEFCLEFQGVGYQHLLWTAGYHPSDQDGLDAAAAQVFAAAAEFEQSPLLPELIAHFPEVPTWFLPSL